MYRIYKNLCPESYNFHVSHSENVSVYPEYNLPPLEVVNLDDTSTTSVVPVNDIYDLFNASRLSGFDNDVIQSIRSNIMQSSQFAEAISKLSDDEIFECIKPRNIQSPSQLVQWSKYLQSTINAKLESAKQSDSSQADIVNEESSTQVINESVSQTKSE